MQLWNIWIKQRHMRNVFRCNFGRILLNYNTERFWCPNNVGSRIHFTSTSWDSCQDYPGRSYDVLRCVRATFIALDFFWSPWTKTLQGKSPFEAPGIYFATTTHYHYHPLLLSISIFLIGYIYIYICECRKGCVFLDLEIDPRVDKTWDRGLVSLPFLLGTSPSPSLPIL